MTRAGGQHRCGECGREGHNRRTCGRVRPVPAQVKTYVVESRENQEPLFTSGGTVDSAYQVFEKGRASHETEIVEEPVTETITAQELETWWALISGKTGKAEETNPKGRYRKGQASPIDWHREDTDRLLHMLDVAETQGADFGTLRDFLNGFGAEPKRELAESSRTPVKVLCVLAETGSADVKKILLDRDGPLPAAVIDRLSSDDDHSVRRAVARRPETPGGILERMYKEYPTRKKPPQSRFSLPSTFLDVAIAGHPNLPPRLRKTLLASGNRKVVRAVLSNHAVTAGELAQAWEDYAAKDEYGGIISAIVGHAETPGRIIDGFLRERIAEGSDTPAGGGTSSGVHLACRNPNASPEVLDMVAKRITGQGGAGAYLHTEVPRSIAENPSTSLETLEWMEAHYPYPLQSMVSDMLYRRRNMSRAG